MVDRSESDSLSEVLKAASDPNRRKILTILVQEGPLRVTDLAHRFEMSLNAVSKHIKVLEKAGLVSRRTEWREHLIAPEMAPLRWWTLGSGSFDRPGKCGWSDWPRSCNRRAKMNELALKVTQRVEARPERVFDAWLDPKMLAQFMRPGPETGTKDIETDPRVGGRYRIVMTSEMGEIPHTGEYQIIDRPHRLVFTWNSPHAAPDSLVTLSFEADGDGTLVTLVHEKFNSDSSRDGHEKGWTGILQHLAKSLA